MFKLLFTIVIALTLAHPVHAGDVAHLDTTTAQKTVIHDQAEAELLLGKHLFINERTCCENLTPSSPFGELTISEQDGLYTLDGERYPNANKKKQDFYPHKESYHINGVIAKITRGHFIFQGTMTAMYYNISKTLQQCTRTGTYEFYREDGIPRWLPYVIWQNLPNANECDKKLFSDEEIKIFVHQSAPSDFAP